MKTSEIISQAAATFHAAAAYIRQYGWQKEEMSADGLPRCSMGALASANPSPSWDKRVAALMYQSLYRELDGLTLTQFNFKFNDGEMVAKLFERTASNLQKNLHNQISWDNATVWNFSLGE